MRGCAQLSLSGIRAAQGPALMPASFERGSLIHDHFSLEPHKVIAQLTVVNRSQSALANMLYRKEMRRLNAAEPRSASSLSSDARPQLVESGPAASGEHRQIADLRSASSRSFAFEPLQTSGSWLMLLLRDQNVLPKSRRPCEPLNVYAEQLCSEAALRLAAYARAALENCACVCQPRTSALLIF
jgi:hypothetical protein